MGHHRSTSETPFSGFAFKLVAFLKKNACSDFIMPELFPVSRGQIHTTARHHLIIRNGPWRHVNVHRHYYADAMSRIRIRKWILLRYIITFFSYGFFFCSRIRINGDPHSKRPSMCLCLILVFGHFLCFITVS